jgi:hypothetical protein
MLKLVFEKYDSKMCSKFNVSWIALIGSLLNTVTSFQAVQGIFRHSE